MTQTATTAAYNAILARYLWIVRGNTTPARPLDQRVLNDIEHGGWEVIVELLEVSWLLELRSANESQATQDAWRMAMASMLPQIAAALRCPVVASTVPSAILPLTQTQTGPQ